MSSDGAELTGRAAELARAFDRTFAEPPPGAGPEIVELLAIRAGERALALRLEHVAALFSDRAITSLPSPLPELLGIASFRGRVVAVYDLAALLGLPRAAAPRWIAIAAERPIALAFQTLDGHWRVPRSALLLESSAEAPGTHVRGVVRRDPEPGTDPAETRPLIDVPAILQTLQGLVRRTHALKEP